VWTVGEVGGQVVTRGLTGYRCGGGGEGHEGNVGNWGERRGFCPADPERKKKFSRVLTRLCSAPGVEATL